MSSISLRVKSLHVDVEKLDTTWTYHRISFVRASDEAFKTVVLDVLDGKRDGRLLGEPTRRRPVLPRPALPRRPTYRAPPCPNPPVVCPGLGFDKKLLLHIYIYIYVYVCMCTYVFIPGHALHGKGFKKQTGVGPLVSSQKRRAAVFPRINRG